MRRKLAATFGDAFRGVAAMLASQRNARIHAAATACVVAAGFYLGLTRLEWCAVVLAIAAVWAAETLNTAFESLADAVSPQHNPMIGRAKDISAGAVLLASFGALIVGLIVFGGRLISLLGRV